MIIIMMKERIGMGYFDVGDITMHPNVPLFQGSFAAGDLELDGLEDIVGGGVDGTYVLRFIMYRQNSSREFFNVTNTVTDDDGFTCALTKPIGIERPIPTWKEVSPK